MTRDKRLQQSFTKAMKLIEIGASYSPLLPKRDGWHTTVVDHDDRVTLVEKYRKLNVEVNNIEEVDVVWRDGTLADAVPLSLHGTFDGLLASHVGEHIPDLIGFFQSVAKLLKPSGAFVLALPDKRLCFDFFRPLTTTGSLLDAVGRTRHSKGTLFDQAAYGTKRGEDTAWSANGPNAPFKLANSFNLVQEQVDTVHDNYMDAHNWRFTPASFQLQILELNLLRIIPWSVVSLEPADGVEFYVWLERRSIQLTHEVENQRLQLLQETVTESKVQVAQLEPPFAEVPVLHAISAIIPLYNGARFIEAALQSVLTQTVPAKEIIVVDDGSTDEGPELVRALSQRHAITLLSKPNGGQSSARNFGIKHSTGDLIALLDQDDLWYPHHLEQLRKPFLEPSIGAELGWVYSDLDEIDIDGSMVGHGYLRTLPTDHPKRHLFSCLREDMFVLPSASLISRKAFNAVGGFDERLSGYEDDDLFLRLFRAGYNNIFLETSLSKWRIYRGSSSYTSRMGRSRAIYFRKLLATYPDDPKRARFVRRDLLLPRFYMHAIAEYGDALISGDVGMIRETRDELSSLVDYLPIGKRIMWRMLIMMRSPAVARLAFAGRRFIHPILRRII